MIRSFAHLQGGNLGFDPAGVTTARVLLPARWNRAATSPAGEPRYGAPEKKRAFFEHVLARLRETPGVEAAGATTYLPLSGWSGGQAFEIEGRPAASPTEEVDAMPQSVNEDYFRQADSGRKGVRVAAIIGDRASAANETTGGRSQPKTGRPTDGASAATGSMVWREVRRRWRRRRAGLAEPAEAEMRASTAHRSAIHTVRMSDGPASGAGHPTGGDVRQDQPAVDATGAARRGVDHDAVGQHAAGRERRIGRPPPRPHGVMARCGRTHETGYGWPSRAATARPIRPRRPGRSAPASASGFTGLTACGQPALEEPTIHGAAAGGVPPGRPRAGCTSPAAPHAVVLRCAGRVP
jgi:hypothetical protein